MIGAGAALLLVLGARQALPQPAPMRTEVPIRAITLSDGVIRYGVPMTIGKTEVLAGLDTGAAGLRVMPDALPAGEAAAGTTAEMYNFGSGTRLDGVIGQARLTIGTLNGPVTLHLVQKAGCVAKSPGCPGTLGLGYGFLGDGLPREGFRVLLGANMGRTTIDQPLAALGARRWIIELPRPGESASGRLILNPTDEEVAGFAMVRLVGGFREQDGGGLYDSVPGCLRNDTTQARVCGPVALDTGAFTVRVMNPTVAPPPWPAGTPMSLEFTGERSAPVASLRMTVGKTAQGLSYGTAPVRGTIIQPGTAPYYAYSVLYDPVRRMLGFKARIPIEGLPAADPKTR